MPLINFEINLILTWYKNSIIASRTVLNQVTNFSISTLKNNDGLY